MRQHLQRLSTWSRAMAGGAALIALFQLLYLLHLLFSGPTAPPPKTNAPASQILQNPAQNAFSDAGETMWKFWTGFALVVALVNAGLNWLAAARWRSAEQYRLLVWIAAFNLALGVFMLNHWFPATVGFLIGLPTALYATGILIGDDCKKVFRLVETGRPLEAALTGGGMVPGLSGKRDAIADAGDLLINDAVPTGDDLGSGGRPAPKRSGARPAAKLSGQHPALDDDIAVTYDLDASAEAALAAEAAARPQLSGQRPAAKPAGATPKVAGATPKPKVSGQRPAPKASGARTAALKPGAKKNPPPA